MRDDGNIMRFRVIFLLFAVNVICIQRVGVLKIIGKQGGAQDVVPCSWVREDEIEKRRGIIYYCSLARDHVCNNRLCSFASISHARNRDFYLPPFLCYSVPYFFCICKFIRTFHQAFLFLIIIALVCSVVRFCVDAGRSVFISLVSHVRFGIAGLSDDLLSAFFVDSLISATFLCFAGILHVISHRCK